MDQEQIAKITGVPSRHVSRYTRLGLIGAQTGGHLDSHPTVSYSHADIHALKMFKLARQSGYKVQHVLDVIYAKSLSDEMALASTLKNLSRSPKPGASTSSHQRLLEELRNFISAP